MLCHVGLWDWWMVVVGMGIRAVSTPRRGSPTTLYTRECLGMRRPALPQRCRSHTRQVSHHWDCLLCRTGCTELHSSWSNNPHQITVAPHIGARTRTGRGGATRGRGSLIAQSLLVCDTRQFAPAIGCLHSTRVRTFVHSSRTATSPTAVLDGSDLAG